MVSTKQEHLKDPATLRQETRPVQPLVNQENIS